MPTVKMEIRSRSALRLVVIITIVLGLLTLPPLAFSQGCALCYTQAANSGARMVRALRDGIVILIIPPLSMCLGAMVLVYRKRNQFRRADAQLESRSEW